MGDGVLFLPPEPRRALKWWPSASVASLTPANSASRECRSRWSLHAAAVKSMESRDSAVCRLQREHHAAVASKADYRTEEHILILLPLSRACQFYGGTMRRVSRRKR